MRLSVLITSYRRPDSLTRCFDSLLTQTRLPNELVVVVRDTDEATSETVERFIGEHGKDIPTVLAKVAKPGVVAATNAGLPHATGDVVCFIDDDAAASRDWLERIEAYYQSDEELGGVGGRDIIHENSHIIDTEATRVGEILWYGKCIGNHNKRTGGPRDVEHLKGCNMSFRRELIDCCDEALAGDGYAWELDISLSVRQRGYRILYDGTLTVDHFPAQRFVGGTRSLRHPSRIYWQCHNLVHVGVKRLAGTRLVAFVCWYFGPHLLRQFVHSIKFLDGGGFVAGYGMFRGLCSGTTARLAVRKESSASEKSKATESV